jgi:pimeloyl-ACP methyl ester carboxylesterase
VRRGTWTSAGVGRAIAAQNDLLLTCPTWRRNATRRPLVFCHGAGGDAFSIFGFGLETIRAAQDGAAVASTDLGGTYTWGNPTSVAAIGSARTFIHSALVTATDKCVLVGSSMGALAALNYARANPALVAGIALLLPSLDLRDLHDNNRGGFAAGIEAAYGGTAGTFDAQATASNPAEHLAAIDALDVPIHVWASTDDPIALWSIVQTFAAATGATVHSVGAAGHDFGSLDRAAFSRIVRGWTR